jgi:hypothetical protein
MVRLPAGWRLSPWYCATNELKRTAILTAPNGRAEQITVLFLTTIGKALPTSA